MEQHRIYSFTFSLVAAFIFGVILWLWWTSFNNPKIYPRPHPAVWETVTISNVDLEGKPLLRLGHYSMRLFGENYRGLSAGQLPILFILLIGAALIALRLQGYRAGLIAPWIAVLAPMSIGLAVGFDDLLTFQAATVIILALLMFADSIKTCWLGLICLFALDFAIQSVLWFSLGLTFLAILFFAIASYLGWAWILWFRATAESQARLSKRTPFWKKFQTFFNAKAPVHPPIFSTFWTLILFYFAIDSVWPIPVDYLMENAGREGLAYLSVFSNPKAALALPHVIWTYMAGPTLVLIALIAFGLAAYWKDKGQIILLLLWLLLPMILFTLINKRNDYYFVAAIPSIYIIASIGIARLPYKTLRIVGAYVIIIAMLCAWFAFVTEPEHEDEFDAFRSEFELMPHPYLTCPYSNIVPEQMDYDYSLWGSNIARICGARHGNVFFMNHTRLDSLLAFYIWHNDPTLELIDSWADPLPDLPPKWIVTDYHNGNPIPFADVFRQFSKATTDTIEAAHNPAIVKVSLDGLNAYRQVASQGKWAIYRRQ